MRPPRIALAAALAALAGCAVQAGPAPVPATIPPPPAPRVEPLPEVVEVEVERQPEPESVPLAAPAAESWPSVERRLQLRATAYCLRGNMRTGVRVREGMAAGDPAVLPLGSVVRVSHPDGRLVGFFVIMDTGGAVRGNRIDLWMASCADARQWGVRQVVAEVLEMGRR